MCTMPQYPASFDVRVRAAVDPFGNEHRKWERKKEKEIFILIFFLLFLLLLLPVSLVCAPYLIIIRPQNVTYCVRVCVCVCVCVDLVAKSLPGQTYDYIQLVLLLLPFLIYLHSTTHFEKEINSFTCFKKLINNFTALTAFPGRKNPNNNNKKKYSTMIRQVALVLCVAFGKFS